VIVENGLEAGERVAVSPMPDAVEGMAVRTQDEEQTRQGAGPS
jgi:hypothetical protein